MAATDSDACKRVAIQVEIDSIRDAIRLNWLEMEYSTLSQVERHAIRTNVARLVQTLKTLVHLPRSIGAVSE